MNTKTVSSTAKVRVIARRFGVELSTAVLDRLSATTVRQVTSWNAKGSHQRLRAWARAAGKQEQWALGVKPKVTA
jgi:hypothetical protein